MVPTLRFDRKLDDNVISEFQATLLGLQNIPGSPYELITGYREWVAKAASHLDLVLTDDELGRLVRTPAYFALATGDFSDGFVQATHIEIARLRNRWTEIVQSCEKFRRHWQAPASLLVLDTNVWVEHPSSYSEIDWRKECQVAPDLAVRVVLTGVVLEELDKLKRELRNKNEDKEEKGRQIRQLRSTIRQFYGMFRDGNQRHLAVKATTDDVIMETTIDLVLEDLDNIRLSINDNEIVKQGLLLASRTAQKVRIVTGDIIMKVRAEAEGLEVVFLDYDALKAPNL